MTYLIDASIFIFRAWFSVPDSMTCPNNHPVNAVYGYTRFLSDFLESVQPDSVAAAFDESLEESFRCEIYPDPTRPIASRRPRNSSDSLRNVVP